MDRFAKPKLYIGCATSREYAETTGVMLSSLDDNGDVPEATVLLADFGLDTAMRRTLRAQAGRLGRDMRFIPIDAESPKIVARVDYPFPLPIYGRYILPREIDEPNARLLLLDSDIVINSSLQPLCYIDMQAHPIAAVFNPITAGQLALSNLPFDPDYLNAGVMLVDVDVFNELGIGEAVMRRLARYPTTPMWLDNDAIVDVLKGNWLRLNRCWNFFYASDEFHFTASEYATAPILHFAGIRPLPNQGHPAAPTYNHHVARAAAKAKRGLMPQD